MAVQTLKKVFRFYVDGFRSMTVGKTLWAIILVKLFIMFAVLKLFFFPISGRPKPRRAQPLGDEGTNPRKITPYLCYPITCKQSIGRVRSSP